MMDGFGPICPVCLTNRENVFQSRALRLALPDIADPVRLRIVEMLNGTGYELLCDCSQCHNAWFHHGWVCPPRWQVHLAEMGRAAAPWGEWQ